MKGTETQQRDVHFLDKTDITTDLLLKSKINKWIIARRSNGGNTRY